MLMNNIWKYASLLMTAAVLSVSCGGDGGSTGIDPEPPVNVDGELTLTIDKDIIRNDGSDAAVLTVKMGETVLTEGVTFFDGDNKAMDIADFKFRTDKSGVYEIWASYLTFNTAKVSVTAVPAGMPETPADPQPEKTSFHRNVLLVQFTGTGCTNCPGMKTILKQVMEEEGMKDKIVKVSAHNYNEDDPAYLNKQQFPGAGGYPTISLDMIDFQALTTGLTYKHVVDWINERHAEEPAKAGIAASVTYADGSMVVKAVVKGAEESNVRVAAFLLENGIQGQQAGAGANDTEMNTHNESMRLADCGNGAAGYALGRLTAGQTAEYKFIWDLNGARQQWNLMPYGGTVWKAPVIENCYVVVCIYTPVAGGSDYCVNNAVVCPINGKVQFDYE